ncbi:MAG TPA: preprotein translocase subunit YajC [Clostridia bacterium]|nr:MAG: preprotein translocase subunit YajC [Firmicutes bacterium ADurb.Bin356]HOF94191.1 preprotein translocase subunit YajC [Clostridia bacterium]HOR12625.1 preprotein translocase subunit YajC [Clostridia bacterium]
MPGSITESIAGFFQGPGLMIVLLVAMFAIMIIPQRRRDKKIKSMLSALKPGDRVRTIGGIYGTIGSIKDDVVTLVVGPDKVRLVFARGAISTVEDVAAENTMSEEVKEIQ